MDQIKTGSLICKLRKEKGLTQIKLAEILNISDKAVSKWECGKGCPDISLLRELSVVLGVDINALLSGELLDSGENGGNMKKIKFYVCPNCDNIINSTGDGDISCCGKRLLPLVAEKAEGEHILNIEPVEDQLYITSDHHMTKEHYISFIAYVTGDKLLISKQYPEWNLQLRLYKMGVGKLYYYCTEHGLFYTILPSSSKAHSTTQKINLPL